MPAKKVKPTKKRVTQPSPSKMESLKAVAVLEKEIGKLKTKHEKTHTQWLTKLKKQIDKGATQIKKMKERVNQAKTASTRKNIAINLKAIHQKQSELKAELKALSKQYKKFVAQEKCLIRFEKDYQKLETKKTNSKRAKSASKKKASTKTSAPVIESTHSPSVDQHASEEERH